MTDSTPVHGDEADPDDMAAGQGSESPEEGAEAEEDAEDAVVGSETDDRP